MQGRQLGGYVVISSTAKLFRIPFSILGANGLAAARADTSVRRKYRTSEFTLLRLEGNEYLGVTFVGRDQRKLIWSTTVSDH